MCVEFTRTITEIPCYLARAFARTLTFLVVGANFTACDDGRVLTLGGREPLPYRFGPPELVANLGVALEVDNPTLTADLLELYFTGGSADDDTDVFRSRTSSTRARNEVDSLLNLLRSVRTVILSAAATASMPGMTSGCADKRRLT